MQFPMAIGGVVPVVNLEGIKPGELKLDADVSPTSTSARSTKWNDQRSQSSTPASSLPDDTITVVHRSDGSGTTWIFTNYLTKVSPDWEGQVGAGTAVNWPDGRGRQGQRGRRPNVKQIKRLHRLRRVRLRQAEQA